LKNFRDIFGQFEYYLEIVDCLSVNFSDKNPEFSEARPTIDEKNYNDDKEINFSNKKNNPKLKPDFNGQEIEREEISSDQTSKKLVKMYFDRQVRPESLLERACWDSIKVVCDVLTDFLIIYMNDGVFIDYFVSTFVILINFIKLLDENKEEVLTNIVLSVLTELGCHQDSGYPDEHKIKCCLNLFEIFEKNKNLKKIEKIKVKLFSLARISFT
jgi:hypothetical protein